MRVHYAIVFVSDMDRSVAFYRDVIGAPLKFQSPHWTEFATEGATLALHKTDQPSRSEVDPAQEPAGSWRSGFQVPDIDAFHQRMIANGVKCLQESTLTFGAKIALYADPDGTPFSASGGRGSH